MRRIVGRYWLQTLGCPKNQVDSDKLEGHLEAQGYDRAPDPAAADLVVVNTCAFIEAARQESIDTVLSLAERRTAGARLVVTGCMAERYGDELRDALPEVDLVAGFGRGAVRFTGGRARQRGARPARRGPDRAAARRRTPPPTPSISWSCPAPPPVPPGPTSRSPRGVTASAASAPSLRSAASSDPARPRRSSPRSTRLLATADDAPPLREVVLVAQDLASYGRDRSGPGRRTRIANGTAPIAALTGAVPARVERTRLLYLYPSGLTDELIDAVLATGVPYFDLSLQHVSRPLLAGMRRWGDGERFLRRIADIRAAEGEATFRSSFILGYPGETERDHDLLLEFLEEAQLDWAGFFPFSNEDGTHAAGLSDQVPAELALERLRECAELQDAITAARRDRLIGEVRQVLVDAPGRGRTVHEAPEIDGIVHLPADLGVGSLVDVVITAAEGPDLHGSPADDREAVPAGAGAPPR